MSGYLWRDSEDMQAYPETDLWQAVRDDSALADFDVRRSRFIQPFTKATQRGLAIV